MPRVIPGVEVSVLRDVIPPQVSPSGVLGLVALIERASGADVIAARSISAFRNGAGRAAVYSAPEAAQAYLNGIREIRVAPVRSSSAKAAGLAVADGAGTTVVRLEARVRGTWGNAIRAQVVPRLAGGNPTGTFDLTLTHPPSGVVEAYRNMKLDGTRPPVDRLNGSELVRVAYDWTPAALTNEVANAANAATDDDTVTLVTSNGADVVTIRATEGRVRVTSSGTQSTSITVKVEGSAGLAGTYSERLAETTFESVDGLVAALEGLQLPTGEALTVTFTPPPPPANSGEPVALDALLQGGADATAVDYQTALASLEDEHDVDLVIASIQDFSNRGAVDQVYAAVLAHAGAQSKDSHGRIGFGQASPGDSASAALERAATHGSERFVVVAPHGALGSVVGRIGQLAYFESPTFRRVVGLPTDFRSPSTEDQRSMLLGTSGKGTVLPVAVDRVRGPIIVRGITTDNDQLSVTRVADYAVRGVKLIGDGFIGRLNNADGREALKQTIKEFLLRMEEEGALVPSTDGTQPASVVNVFSNQLDFAQGIVRVEIAVRPVRAIDYIYATISVQA